MLTRLLFTPSDRRLGVCVGILCRLLRGEDASTSNSLDLLLGPPGEEPGLNNDGLLGEDSLAQHFEETSSGTVNDRGFSLRIGIL